ncbi:UNVERIFIED_ORG: tellurite resistance protein TehA-like permease [Providencia alcalifaciens]
MLRHLHHKVRGVPTPVAGLALGIASLGLCLENALPLHGIGQNTGALIATVLLCVIAVRFIFHSDTLVQDLKHPVLGSIVPTFAMAVMIVSKALGNFLSIAGQAFWLGAIVMHLIALVFFIYHRAKEPNLHHMVPSWFIPPVGIIVAAVTCPSDTYTEFALVLLGIGMVSYIFMLPMMIYRFIFRSEVPDSAKPTIAIMAAPASLALAGYLTVVKDPSMLICAVLLGVALLMTIVIYCVFFRLLRLPFSAGYAAFTFPMAIGATALYKVAYLLSNYPQGIEYAHQVFMMATIEAVVATVVIGYVSVRFIYNYTLPQRLNILQIFVK